MQSMGIGAAILTMILLGSFGAQEKKQGAPQRVAELIQVLEKGNDAQRWEALLELQSVGPAAAPALPRLIELLREKNEELRLASCLVLGKIGAKAVPPLIAALEAKDPSVRYYACWALGANGAAAKDAVPALLKQLQRPQDPGVFRRAALALGEIGQQPDRVIPALLKTLAEIDDHRENGVVEAVARFGAAAVPFLVEPLQRGERSSSFYVALIAGRIGAPAKELLPHLEKQLAMTPAGEAALKAMVQIGPDAAPLLAKHVNRGAVEWQLQIVDRLAELGAWHDVVAAVDADAVEVRRRAVAQMDSLGGSQAVVIAGLMHALKSRDHPTIIAAHVALQRRGAEAKRAIPALLDALLGPDAIQHAQGLTTLQALQHDPRPTLREALAGKDTRRRAMAGYWLAVHFDEKGEAPLVAMSVGLDALENVELREVAKALAFRKAKGKAVPILARFLKTEPDSEERFRIIQALYPLAEIDDDAIRAIAIVLNDPAADVRADGARFLGGLAPRSHIELPALRKALEDPDGTVRQRAQEAIAAIEKKKS